MENPIAPATKEEQELIEYLENETKRIQQWVSEGEGRWATTPCSDLKWLREMEYTSLSVYLRKQKEYEYYDFYKSVHGIKPRWIKFDSISDEELDRMLSTLHAEGKEMREWEEKRNAEELAKEAQLCEQFGVDTLTLVKWGVLEPCTPWRCDRFWMDLELQMMYA